MTPFPIHFMDPDAGAARLAAVDPRTYWLRAGPSMVPSMGGTGTAAIVSMETIPMGTAIPWNIHRDRGAGDRQCHFLVGYL
jgi:hypothetical protein